MDRMRDRRGYDDRESGYSGETYRPKERTRSPPRNFRGRSPPPPRRPRSPHGGYPPRGGRFEDRQRSRSPPRRRSRSPLNRGPEGDHNYRGRVRSPLRTTGRARSPGFRRGSRTPPPYGQRPRPKSPYAGRRDRGASPPGSYRRSPPGKHGRAVEDRDNYTSRRPYGREEKRFPHENNYRARDRSRTPPRVSAHTSRCASPDSRHSGSGQMHPDRHDRIEQIPERSRRSSPLPRSPRHEPAPAQRSPEYRNRDRSPIPRNPSPRPRSPPRSDRQWHDRSPAVHDRDQDFTREPPPRAHDSPPRSATTPNTWSGEQMSAPRFQNGDSRAPPTGPRERFGPDNSRDAPPSGLPTGPSAPNTSRGSILSAPTRPSRDSGYRGRGRGHYSGPPTPRTASYDRDVNAPPTGPRGSGSYAPSRSPPPRYDSGPSRYDSGPPYSHSSYSSGPRGSHSHGYGGPPPFRSNNSTSTTYPRTQRFNTASTSTNSHLSSLPQVIEGGRKAPSLLEPAQEKRLVQLEDEKRKLEEQILEKEKTMRQGLREWEKAEREAKREGLKARLAEEHLAKLSGEVAGGGAGAY